MKAVPLVFVAVIAMCASVCAQEASITDASDPNATPVATEDQVVLIAPTTDPTAARIIGNIPDGTPPPPSPPKPAFVVRAQDVLATTTHEQGGRTITIQRIKPIALPPPPEPAQPVVQLDDAALQARVAAFQTDHPSLHIFSIGATVYRFKDSPTRTRVQYRFDPKGEPITFWSSADFSLIAGGIHTFVDSVGETHSLMMGWGYVYADKTAAVLASHGREYQVPNIPVFPDGPATYAIVGQAPAAEALVPIQSLHELYNREYVRLKAAYDGREAARIQHEAELKANPPQPKNIVLNYWRTEKPASMEKGGTAQ